MQKLCTQRLRNVMQTYKKVKKGEKHTLYLQKQGFCLKMIFSRFNRYKRHLSRAFCDAKKISTINFQSTDSFILATLRERKGEEKKKHILMIMIGEKKKTALYIYSYRVVFVIQLRMSHRKHVGVSFFIIS